jgi:hypothetical protein
MSFNNPPSPPDPSQTAQTQQQYNLQAGQTQQQLNMVNQTNPLGSLSYTQSGTNPDGTPKYTANTSYSPQVQSLLDKYLGAANTTGQTAQNLASNIQGMYSSAPDIGGTSAANLKQLTNWNDQYNAPIFKQQQSNLDASLRNQGINPGSQAWDNAQNLLARNQGDVRNQFFTQAEPISYNQAVTSYQLPLQTYSQLSGLSQPTAPNFQATPTAQIQPANFAGLTSQNYQNQLQNYQNQQAGMWGLVGTGINAAAKVAPYALALA